MNLPVACNKNGLQNKNVVLTRICSLSCGGSAEGGVISSLKGEGDCSYGSLETFVGLAYVVLDAAAMLLAVSVTFLFGDTIAAAAGAAPDERLAGAGARLAGPAAAGGTAACVEFDVIIVEEELRLAKFARAAVKLPACLFF